MRIEAGTWLKDNDPRHHERYLYVKGSNPGYTYCLSVKDAKAGHGSYDEDVRVRRTTIATDRIHTDGKTRRYGYSVVPKAPSWAVDAINRRLAKVVIK